MGSSSFVVFLVVLIVAICGMGWIAQKFMASTTATFAWIQLLTRYPGQAVVSLWMGFWGSWVAVGIATTVLYAMAFASDIIGFSLAKVCFVTANVMFVARLCIEEKLHGPNGNRKHPVERVVVMFIVVSIFGALSFFECGSLTNKQRGLPATTGNIWKASFWWRQSATSTTAKTKADSVGSASTSAPKPEVTGTLPSAHHLQSPPNYSELSNSAVSELLKDEAGNLENQWSRWWTEDERFDKQHHMLQQNITTVKGQLVYPPGYAAQMKALTEKRERVGKVFVVTARDAFREADAVREESVRRVIGTQEDEEERIIFRSVIKGDVKKFKVGYVHKHADYLKALADRVEKSTK